MPDDQYYVVVGLTKEDMFTAPYVTVRGHSVEVALDGSLHIKSDTGGRSFGARVWHAFELKVIPVKALK